MPAAQLLTYDQVAERLGITKRAVQNMVASGRLRYVTPTGKARIRRIREDDLNKHIQANSYFEGR